MKICEDYTIVSGRVNISGVTMRAKFRYTRDSEHCRLISKEKMDSVSFEFGMDYVNKIYTDRATGNVLYKAFVDGKIKADCPAELKRAAIEYLKSIGAKYSVMFELGVCVK